MPTKRDRYMRDIKSRLDHYGKLVKWEEGRLSESAEALYRGLLNKMFGCDLKNMNRERRNFPGIDLGNDKQAIWMEDCEREVRLGVQVTSTTTWSKVRHTLDEFFSNELHERFDRLVVLAAGEVKPFPEEPVLKETFDFQTKRDVWDERKLLEIIGDLPSERLEAVWKFLLDELTMPESRQRLNLPLQSGMAAKNFVGREEELRELAQRFEQDQIVVLSGLGGMGKTELAVRFGREYEESGRGWAYFLYFSGSFSATLRSNVTGIIPGYSPEGKTEEQIVADALAALNRCGKGDLLILDNADEGSITALRRELSALRMRVLVTSRKAVPGAVRVEPLSNDALYAVFELNDVNISKEEMDALIGAVNAHTLTVDVMARTMGRGRRSATPEKMLAALKERELSRGFTKVEIDYAGSPEQARINEHLKAVFRVAELAEEAQTLLCCATLLPESGMDDELFLAPFAEEAGDRLDDLIEGGWLYMKDGLLCIHPVIRIVCVEVLKPSEENCERFLVGIDGQYDQKHYDAVKFRQMAEVLENAACTLEDHHDGFWAGEAGYYWAQVGEAVRALSLQLRELELQKRNNPNSKVFATVCNNVGYVYGLLGDHQEELKYYMEALEIRERVLKTDHPEVARSYNNVGVSFDELGDHEQALRYKLKAVEIWEKVLEADHPDLAISYNNVGVTYSALGNHKQALKYQMKAMEIKERVLSRDHPEIATSYSNIGMTYDDLGDKEKALEYLLEGLRIREKVLPENHHDIAISCNNIALTLYELGQLNEAADYMRRAADIVNRSPLPAEHKDRININKWAERLEEEARQEETV